ncbi:MAG: hypothetical protein KIC42_05190 [Prevotella histicola]|uniref:hypothetical protein n=1 Tax=Prevotella histicola TaxID=470565 RepID=UPI00241EDE1C|nr:hypothetical protein [Prevotella histicola]MBS5897722.1 hypothetical protein [Prevotella histicola]
MGKQEGKKLTKTKSRHQRKTASPSPSGGGDVRGNGGIRKEGMCLAGCWVLGIEKDEKIGLKGQCFILKIIKFRSQGIAL